jgi:hypothetical protein
MVRGAGTRRQVGRLAFFIHYPAIRTTVTRHIKQMLKDATNRERSTVFDDRPGKVYDDRLEVVIITSLAGGTGSGMFIDIAYLVRDILANDSDLREQLKSNHTTLVAVLPTIYKRTDPSLAERFEQNAYAALLEMEFYNTPRPEDTVFASHGTGQQTVAENQPVEFVVNWEDPQAYPNPIEAQAWDTCYLIDDVNDHKRIGSPDFADVYQMIADYLFLDFGTSNFAVAKRSARSNHRQLRDRILGNYVVDQGAAPIGAGKPPALYENKYGCTFGSFGLSEILIDKDRINRAASYRLAQRLVNSCWLADDRVYSDDTYENWTKHDLHSGEPPYGETEGLSFHPDDLSDSLLQREDVGKTWLADVQSELDQVESSDPSGGLQKLSDLLKSHTQRLESAGQARRTLEHRRKKLAGTATELGPLRERVARLVRERFNRIGAKPTLKLLAKYHWAFGVGAQHARKLGKQGGKAEAKALARVRDAQRVPFPLTGVATRIEFERAAKSVRSACVGRYRGAAAGAVEELSNELQTFVGKEGQRKTMRFHTSLTEQYEDVRDFLTQLSDYLGKRFEELMRIGSRSDRKIPLLPQWEGEQYDEEIELALLKVPDVEDKNQQGKINWRAAEAAATRELCKLEDEPLDLYEIVGSWRQSYSADKDVLPSIGDELAHACQQVIGKNIDLKRFQGGNVVDYLIALGASERRDLVERSVDAAFPYLPSISATIQDFQPAYRTILGLKGSDTEQGRRNAARVAKEISDLALAGSKNDERDKIHATEDSTESSVVHIREMGGVALYYYSRLNELRKAYLKADMAPERKFCHIDHRRGFEELPDIGKIQDDDYANIRDNFTYVLRAFLLKRIEIDEEGIFAINVPPEGGTFGEYTIRLGTQMNRIVKHGSTNAGVQRYLKQWWSNWIAAASDLQVAVLYCAIQQNLLLFPQIQDAHEQKYWPPLFNCFNKLLPVTEEDLKAKEPQGAWWFETLCRKSDLDPGYEQWKSRYEVVAKEIREKCLQPASRDLPLYQINEHKLAEIQVSGQQTPQA